MQTFGGMADLKKRNQPIHTSRIYPRPTQADTAVCIHPQQQSGFYQTDAVPPWLGIIDSSSSGSAFDLT